MGPVLLPNTDNLIAVFSHSPAVLRETRRFVRRQQVKRWLPDLFHGLGRRATRG